ncbi:hypothetical protein LHJ74_13995 [Streptomyces sp. N2-109]|uniref:Uncharacterized protein n=1 Tax=Streptomyces gossypii TaxID=2883101 RepID=A0ABT2JT21_9ACTN|nr:hypothetical protein [Streptomyces gossypii]MCT2591008.1 hypothetical protein [Streptomyces gossypii]
MSGWFAQVRLSGAPAGAGACAGAVPPRRPLAGRANRRTLLARTDGAAWCATVRPLGVPWAPYTGTVPQSSGDHDRWSGDVHLWAEPGTGGGDRWAESADVLHAALPALPRQAGPRAQALLAGYPGALLASVGLLRDGGCLTWCRAGWSLLARPVPGAALTRDQRVCLVSFLHAWLAGGRAVASLRSLSLSGRSDVRAEGCADGRAGRGSRPAAGTTVAGHTEVSLAYRKS